MIIIDKLCYDINKLIMTIILIFFMIKSKRNFFVTLLLILIFLYLSGYIYLLIDLILDIFSGKDILNKVGNIQYYDMINGYKYMKKNNYVSAIKSFKHSINDSTKKIAYYEIGNCYNNLGSKYDKKKEKYFSMSLSTNNFGLCSELIKLMYDNKKCRIDIDFDCKFTLGIYNLRRNNYRLSELYLLDCYNNASSNNIKDVCFSLGDIYLFHMKNNMYKCVKYYKIAIENGSVSAMNNLGIYYYEKKKYNLSKKYYKMAICNKKAI